MKPLIKWSGGKADEIDEIMKYVPQNYDTYVEPFVGGGALFFHLAPQKSVINDIHPDLINLYSEIKNGNGDQIWNLMDASEFTEEEYYKVRDNRTLPTPVEKAFQFYYLRKTCYRGMLRYNKKGHFNIPYGRYAKVNYEDVRNPQYHDVLSRATIHNEDFSVIFDKYNSENNFCFIDQPYDSEFTDYGYCKFEHPDQERLASAFKASKMKCLMIVGDTPYIRGLYSDYIVGSYPKNYKFRLHSGRVGNEINKDHLVIMNYSCTPLS
jgi:DNA adenine methylase